MKEVIIKNSKKRAISKGTVLFREGDVCRSFVYLHSGIARHFVLEMSGKEITKNFTVGGNFASYSISSFLSQQKGIVQFEAITDLVIYELSYTNWLELMTEKKFQEFWNNLLTNFIIKKEKKELSLLRDNALKRYNDFQRDFPELLDKIPHYYIASYLSVSPETLSRIRHKSH